MEQWIPLFGVGITAVATVGIAFWNSRGQSKDVARLKAMNDVVKEMPEDSAARQALEEARDTLALRVAARIAAAPRRARLVWRTLLVGVAVAAGIASAWLLSPVIAPDFVLTLNVLSTLALLGGTGWLAWSLTASARVRQLEKEQEDADALVRYWNDARLRAMKRRINDPDRGRST